MFGVPAIRRSALDLRTVVASFLADEITELSREYQQLRQFRHLGGLDREFPPVRDLFRPRIFFCYVTSHQ
jgi:hypothetical protein